jgi:hypothetical protein
MFSNNRVDNVKVNLYVFKNYISQNQTLEADVHYKKLSILLDDLLNDITASNETDDQKEQLFTATSALIYNILLPMHDIQLAKQITFETQDETLTNFKLVFGIRENDCTKAFQSTAAVIAGIVSGILLGIVGAIVGFFYGLCQWRTAGLACIPCTFYGGYHGFTNGFNKGHDVIIDKEQDTFSGTPRTLVATIQEINPHLFWKKRLPVILTKQYETLTASEQRQAFRREATYLTTIERKNLFATQTKTSLEKLDESIKSVLKDPSVKRDTDAVEDYSAVLKDITTATEYVSSLRIA